MRANNVLKNGMWGLAYRLVCLVLSFVGRTVFLHFLSAEYLGIAGLFTNVLSVLSLSELGFSTAVSFHLYKLLAAEDHEKTAALMNFYKTVYRIVAAFIFVAGATVLPFLKFIIKDTTFDIWYISIIFALYVIKSSTSYLFTYNYTIATADQNARLLSGYDIAIHLTTSITNIIVLVVFHNVLPEEYHFIVYIIYLAMEIAVGIVGNMVKALRVRRKYPYIKSKAKIDPETRKRVMKDVSNIFASKVATVVINATDNILISSLISITTVGYYDNYYMIISQVQMVLGEFTSATQSSLGNMLAFESKDYSYSVLKKLTVIVYFATSFCAVCLFNLLNPFINIWLGEEYLLGLLVVALCVWVFYIRIVKAPLWFSLNGVGYFKQDRNIAIWGAASNLGVSILCVYLFRYLWGPEWALAGIFVGTLFSQLTQMFMKAHLFINKYLGRKMWEFIGLSFGLMGLTAAMCAIVYFGFKWIPFSNEYAALFARFGGCLVVPNLLNFLIFRRSEAFKYLISFVKRILKRKPQKAAVAAGGKEISERAADEEKASE